MLEAKTSPLDALPLTPFDRRFLEGTLDLLPEDPVTDYDLAEYVSAPGGNNVFRQWDSCRLIRVAPTHGRAVALEDFGWFDPIPSRRQVEDALQEAAETWREKEGSR